MPENKSTEIVHLKESLSLEEAGQVEKEESKALQLNEHDDTANCVEEDVIPLKIDYQLRRLFKTPTLQNRFNNTSSN